MANAIGTNAIGPNFFAELQAAGLAGLPFAWSADGTLTFMPAMTAAQIAAVQAVYAAHNPNTLPPAQILANALAAGITIQSTGTPALNGTYALDAVSQARITAIYAGIKGGDGLPLGQAVFNYPDAAGGAHSWSAISFPNFAKAVRDYVYQLMQGQTPTTPVVIP